MADLPELALPRGLPCWLAASHSVEPSPLYADVQVRTGHARKRRVYRSAPRTVAVGLDLSESQMQRFFFWFEDTLRAGTEPFAAHLPNQGPGLLWWRARFVEPPVYEARAKGRWRVTAKLLLTGSGSATGPVNTTLASTASIALFGSVDVTVLKPLASQVLIELVRAERLRSTALIELLPGVAVISYPATVPESAAIADASNATQALLRTSLEATVTSDAFVGTPGTPTDPNFSSVVLLAHGNGSSGGTSFSDSSSHARTIAPVGDVQTSTAQSPFGGGSILFDGASDYLTIANSPDFDLGNGDFTLECWVYHTGFKTNKTIAANRDSAGLGGFFWYINNNGTLRFDAYDSAGATFISLTSPTVPADTWVHCAISRVGTNVRAFTYGVLRQAVSVGTAAVGPPGTDLTIGSMPFLSSADYLGHLGEFRFTKGVGRYSADFAPPPAPFPNS